MTNQYTIIVCPGHYFHRMLRAIRSGLYLPDYFKIVSLTGDVSEKDLLSFAKKLAISSYLEGKTFSENITNAFILKGNTTECMTESKTAVLSDSILNGISITMPIEEKEESTVTVYSSEEIFNMLTKGSR